MKDLMIVRGGGDLATGTIYKLKKCGFPVLVLETHRPSAIRRKVSFSEAVYAGRHTVEDMTCFLAHSPDQAEQLLGEGKLTLLVDPEGKALQRWQPLAVVDAILAKKNCGTHRAMAPITIGLGPGFTAGMDVDAVIETKRGHDLGRVLYEGQAAPNTGIPGEILGCGRERVIYAPAEGTFHAVKKITDEVRQGETIAVVETGCGCVPVTASLGGLLRGLLPEGYPVTRGFKCADIDPRMEEYHNCFTISDKSRCIAGGVLEAIMHLKGERGL